MRENIAWILALSFLFFVLPACNKDNDTPGDPPISPQLSVYKIIGPLIYDEYPYIAFSSDSTYYHYDNNNRIKRIEYYGKYEQNGITVVYTADSDFTYDTKGNVNRISFKGVPIYPEKEINFRYDTLGNVLKATIVYRAQYGMNENDSAVLTYLHYFYPNPDYFVNGHGITHKVTSGYETYGNKAYVEKYLLGQRFTSSYSINKDNSVMETWQFPAGSFDRYRLTNYDIVDTNIVGMKYWNDNNSHLPPYVSETYERTTIPSIPLMINKSIFSKNYWLSNIGIFSPFHAIDVSTFMKRPIPGVSEYSYQVDSKANTLTQLAKDQYGNFEPLRTFYFR